MNYKNKVFNKLFTKEVELSKEQIELNLIADIKKGAATATNKYNDSIKKTGKIFSLVSSATAEIKEAINLADKLLKEADKFEAAAKDLGLDVPTDVKRSIAELYDISQGGGKAHLKSLENAKASF